jgi:lipopolysaccharide transport system ATP-binding protein
MSDHAIRVDGLSKQYRIGSKHQGYKTLRETLAETFASPFRRAQELLRGQAYGASGLDETIWALKDVSFEIKRGEVVGIIGRNGAGKTTLLKVLSRITEPTEGQAEIYGRVGSLLEVGTGFHPELTGRENIYLSGVILGMKKAEIAQKFDEIVAFAEIEKFIDTPVKHYSSGMYVRLAFAVAAHLEPEILLVDEVLAVGDAAFQKKCLGKMGQLAKEGRTVLFVSHNMGVIAELCHRVILIRSGMIALTGSARKTISKYLEEDSYSQRVDLFETKISETHEGKYRLAFVETRNQSGELCSNFVYGENIIVRIGIVGRKDARIALGVGVRDSFGRQILHFDNISDNSVLVLREESTCFELCFENILNENEYYLTVWIGDTLLVVQEYASNCLRFSVDTSPLGKSLVKGLVIQPGHWYAVKLH